MLQVTEIGADGLPHLVTVRDAVRPDDPLTPSDLVDWRGQAEDMVWLVATDERGPVGAGMALVGWHSKTGTARAEAWTTPGARGRGVGQALFAALLAWAGERGCVAVETRVADDDATSLAWADRRGFREIGRELTVALELADVEAPAIAPPAGIEVVSWADRPELAQGMYDVFREASPDVPGEEHAELPSFERWLAADMQGAGDRPECVFVALAGDEVVGYAKLSVTQGTTDVAWHDLTGVKRAWRGRGIASALKRAQIAWAKEHGYARLVTANEERNAPIRHLNRRYGYRPHGGMIVLSTTISGPD